MTERDMVHWCRLYDAAITGGNVQVWKALLITVVVGVIIFFIIGPTVQHLPGVVQYLSLAAFAALVIWLFEYLRKPRK